MPQVKDTTSARVAYLVVIAAVGAFVLIYSFSGGVGHPSLAISAGGSLLLALGAGTLFLRWYTHDL